MPAMRHLTLAVLVSVFLASMFVVIGTGRSWLADGLIRRACGSAAHASLSPSAHNELLRTRRLERWEVYLGHTREARALGPAATVVASRGVYHHGAWCLLVHAPEGERVFVVATGERPPPYSHRMLEESVARTLAVLHLAGWSGSIDQHR